jgi:hypothetical protein
MRETTGSLVSLDGRLWRTLYALVAKPGFLTQEYFRGRRKRYVRPARLYLVTSVILFAVLRLTTEPLRFDERVIKLDDQADLAAPPDAQLDTNTLSFGSNLGIGIDRELHFFVKGPRNVVTDELRARFDHFNRLSAEEKGKQISSGLLQYGPYAMFVLLPLFAWLQQMSYIGRLRSYPGRPQRYIEHLVYSTHLHCVMFLAAAVALLLPWTWLRLLVLLWLVLFVLRGKHRVYGGSRVGGLIRTLFVVVTYRMCLTAALLVLIFPAILVS